MSERETPEIWWHDLTPEEQAEFFRAVSPEESHEWFTRMCRDNGYPDKITDPQSLARIARILAKRE